MPRQNSRSRQRIARQFSELALAAPQVVLQRTGRMARAGFSRSAADRAEFTHMTSEKVFAFWQSWAGMWTAAAVLQMEFVFALPSATLSAMQGRNVYTLARASDSAVRIMTAGLGPVHRKAVANTRRLALRTT